MRERTIRLVWKKALRAFSAQNATIVCSTLPRRTNCYHLILNSPI